MKAQISGPDRELDPRLDFLGIKGFRSLWKVVPGTSYPKLRVRVGNPGNFPLSK